MNNLEIKRGTESLADIFKRKTQVKPKRVVEEWQDLASKLIAEACVEKYEQGIVWGFAKLAGDNGMRKIYSEWKQGEIKNLIQYLKWLKKN